MGSPLPSPRSRKLVRHRKRPTTPATLYYSNLCTRSHKSLHELSQRPRQDQCRSPHDHDVRLSRLIQQEKAKVPAATMEILLLLPRHKPIPPRLRCGSRARRSIIHRHATESGPRRALDAMKLDRYGSEVSDSPVGKSHHCSAETTETSMRPKWH